MTLEWQPPMIRTNNDSIITDFGRFYTRQSWSAWRVISSIFYFINFANSILNHSNIQQKCNYLIGTILFKLYHRSQTTPTSCSYGTHHEIPFEVSGSAETNQHEDLSAVRTPIIFEKLRREYKDNIAVLQAMMASIECDRHHLHTITSETMTTECDITRLPTSYELTIYIL